MKYETGLVSCVVPVFNGEKYIQETLHSILAQTYKHLELIVADDGSTDNTKNLVAEFGSKVKCLSQANQGPAAARNLGLLAAQGEFIAFLDADDLWHKEKLERQIARFEQNAELDLCVTHIKNFWTTEMENEAIRHPEHRRSRPLPGYSSTTLLARRSLFNEVGLFNTKLKHCDDTQWFLRVNESGAESVLLPDVLTFRRMHKTNRSKDLATASLDEYLKLIKMSLDRRRKDESTVRPYSFPTTFNDDNEIQ